MPCAAQSQNRRQEGSICRLASPPPLPPGHATLFPAALAGLVPSKVLVRYEVHPSCVEAPVHLPFFITRLSINRVRSELQHPSRLERFVTEKRPLRHVNMTGRTLAVLAAATPQPLGFPSRLRTKLSTSTTREALELRSWVCTVVHVRRSPLSDVWSAWIV
jgi:hypothetical protein